MREHESDPQTSLYLYEVKFEPEELVPLAKEQTRLRMALINNLEKLEDQSLVLFDLGFISSVQGI